MGGSPRSHSERQAYLHLCEGIRNNRISFYRYFEGTALKFVFQCNMTVKKTGLMQLGIESCLFSSILRSNKLFRAMKMTYNLHEDIHGSDVQFT